MYVVARWTGGLAVPVLAFAVLLLSGCVGAPVTPLPHADAIPPRSPLLPPVTFNHTKEFREAAFGPYQMGAASDPFLRSVYPKVFVAVSDSAAGSGAKAGAETATGVLEPEIQQVRLMNAAAPAATGPWVAEADYRFKLTASTGTLIAKWRIRGIAEYALGTGADRPRGEGSPELEVLARAMEDAARGFVASFESDPILARWSKGEPITGAEADPEEQISVALGPGETAAATYPGVVSVRAIHDPLPRLPRQNISATPDMGIDVARLTFRNEGDHALHVDYRSIGWYSESGQPGEALPPRVASALLVDRPLAVAIAPMGPGIAALPALFATLISAADQERARTEIAALIEQIRSDALDQLVVAPGESAMRRVYLLRPDKGAPRELRVPVVDRESGVRYTVALPFVSQ